MLTVSPLMALAIAERKLPAPLSAQLLTLMVLAIAGAADNANKAAMHIANGLRRAVVKMAAVFIKRSCRICMVGRTIRQAAH